ncbi:hypothetical protein M2429_000219 [Enterobacter sp. A4]
MSIHIEINNQYVITSDLYQFILQEKRPLHPGKMKVRNGWTLWVTTQLSLSLSQAWFCMIF